MTTWRRRQRKKYDLHFLNESGRVACDPRDREAAHRAEVKDIATKHVQAVTCKKYRAAIRKEWLFKKQGPPFGSHTV